MSGRDIEGDRDEAAEPSPVLGITGKRPLRFRLEGIGVGTGLASKLPSL